VPEVKLKTAALSEASSVISRAPSATPWVFPVPRQCLGRSALRLMCATESAREFV
jgi:hypothetical protein